MGRGLGKGLQALIPGMVKDEEPNSHAESVTEVELSAIEPNRDQPRKHFDPEALNELARSIEEHGVIQPLVVRPLDNGRYQLVVGERRWRACQQIGLAVVPVVIRDWDNQKTAEVALIENIQRQDLNPLEEAFAFRTLMDDFRMTQEQLAKRIGKSRSYIANSLRLIHLPESTQELIASGKLSSGHAKVILGLDDPQEQAKVASLVVEGGWSVRKTEEEVRSILPQKDSQRTSPPPGGMPLKNSAAIPQRIDPDIFAMEERLRSWLKTKVKIRHNGEQGHIEISYFSPEDLQRLFDAFFSEAE